MIHRIVLLDIIKGITNTADTMDSPKLPVLLTVDLRNGQRPRYPHVQLSNKVLNPNAVRLWQPSLPKNDWHIFRPVQSGIRIESSPMGYSARIVDV